MRSWTFDPGTMRLEAEGVCVNLTPKASAMLACLLRHEGQTVSRETLLSEIWPGLNVTEGLVREYIFDLRSALGDNARDPTYIETIRGKGFRLIGPVQMKASGAGRAQTSGPGGDVRVTVAVMRPTRSESDWDCQQFADCVVRDITTDLSQHHDIAVISQQAAFAMDRSGDPRETAAELGADYLLDSAFVIHEGTVRVSFHLVDGKTARHIWTERIDHSFQDLLTLSDKIVDAVVGALVGWHGELHRAEFKSVSARDSNELNSFENFIRACDIDMRLNEPEIRRSLVHLDRSLELDPSFARCWVIKSVMSQWAIDIIPEPEEALLTASADAIERAYSLDPYDPTTLGYYAMKRARDGDLNGAADLTNRAAQAAGPDPDAAITISTSLALIGADFDGAVTFLNRAFELNPTPPGWYKFIEARVAYFAGHYDRSIAASYAGTEHVSGLAFRCLSHTGSGDRDAALNAYSELIERYPRFDFDRYAKRMPVAHPEALARFRAGTDQLRKLLSGDAMPGLAS